LLVATSLVAGYFAYIYNLKRQSYLLYWTAGWGFLALHYLGSAMGNGGAIADVAMGQALFSLAGIFFYLGARKYAHRKQWRLPRCGCSTGACVDRGEREGYLTIPVTLAGTAIYVFVGLEFWMESRLQETLADWLLANVFFLAGPRWA